MAGRTTESAGCEFEKTESGVKIGRFRPAGEEPAVKTDVLQKPAVFAFQQITILDEQTQFPSLCLQSDQLCRQSTEFEHAWIHRLAAAVRLTG